MQENRSGGCLMPTIGLIVGAGVGFLMGLFVFTTADAGATAVVFCMIVGALIGAATFGKKGS